MARQVETTRRPRPLMARDPHLHRARHRRPRPAGSSSTKLVLRHPGHHPRRPTRRPRPSRHHASRRVRTRHPHLPHRPQPTRPLTDPGLCHGWAGLYQTIRHIARDARSPELAKHLPDLATAFAHRARNVPVSPGLLAGAAGIALTLTTAAVPETPTCGWDACLLTN
ncbi:lanthionine synthetase LanC family protein [Streptomyces sulphureus]|uniref:lanthionine synthetase LanC family protein n=1 Tax=Streptomyces sulphureus TaxID=47758 RepID=UPI003CCB8AD3